MSGTQNDGYLGMMDPTTGTDPFNAISFAVSQIINKKWTITLGLVKAVRGGGAAGPPTVDVQPMVNELDGRGQATPHGVIAGLPAFRLQGGAGAFVIDPRAGDIGVVAFASRDVSSVVKNRAPANPGSFRTFDPADGIYFGGLLGGAPSRYIQITDDGVSIVFSDTVKVELSAAGFKATVGPMVFEVTEGGITLNGIDWATHTHPVSTAPGETGAPA